MVQNNVARFYGSLASWQALMGKSAPSSICWSQFFCGRRGMRFQSAVGVIPVKASIDKSSACEAAVFLGKYGQRLSDAYLQ